MLIDQLSIQLDEYQKITFRSRVDLHLKSAEDAVRFVNERGFIFFWPIKGLVFPSLWEAVTGKQYVPSNHDDPGHITWSWKDDLLDKRKWYYAKVLRGKNTFISFDCLPYFYTLSNNYGSPETDHLILYETGNLTYAAKQIYEALLREGPLNTIDLRRICHLQGRSQDSAFNQAMVFLQTDFKILPIAISQAGGWNYAFIYDLVPRYYPDLLTQTRTILENQARQKLITDFMATVGAANQHQIQKFFHWPLGEINKALQQMLASKLVTQLEISDQPSQVLFLSSSLIHWLKSKNHG